MENGFYDEEWELEHAHDFERFQARWNSVMFYLKCAGVGILVFVLTYFIAWIGMALND